MNEFTALLDENNHRDFIGRKHALRELDAAMSRDQPVVLVHGVGGIGKTTIVARIAQQLLDSRTLTPDRLFWFSFEWSIRTAEYVINHLGIKLLGINFLLESTEKRIDMLADALRRQECLLVWDNFEVVHGIESKGEQAKFRLQDQQDLLQLLQKLRGGSTKVLVTSRSDEAWLGTENCCRMELKGFTSEERWEYGQAILLDDGLQVDCTNRQLVQLLDLTDGHPIAMRILLSKLQHNSANTLCSALNTQIQSLGDESAGNEKNLYAAMQYIEQSIPICSRPILAPLALHERFVDRQDLEAMAAQVDIALTQTEINALLQTLAQAGLLDSRGATTYHLHPVLTRYLCGRALGQSEESWQRAFVDVLASCAASVPPTKEPCVPCYLHDLNFQTALNLADRWNMDSQFCDLISWLSPNVRNKRDFEDTIRGYQETADAKPVQVDPQGEMARYRKLGMLAQHQRDFSAAAVSFHHTLEIAKEMDDEKVVARNLYSLAQAKQQSWQLKAAETLYQKALNIFEKQGDEYNSANIYDDLGLISLKLGDFGVAEMRIQKARVLFEQLGDEFDVAGSYYRLGLLAEAKRDFKAAIPWYEKSLEISLTIGNERSAGLVYHRLSVIPLEQEDFDEVDKWFQKSLDVCTRQGNDYDLAATFYGLGTQAHQRHDFDTAEKWLQRAIEIAEQQDNQSVAAFAHHYLALNAAAKGDLDRSERLYLHALRLFEQYHKDDASMTYHQLGLTAHSQDDLDAAEKWYRKSLEIEERRGNEHGAAITYHNMGSVAEKRGDFEAAETWLWKSLQIREKQGNEIGIANSYHQLGIVAHGRQDCDSARKWYLKSLEINEKIGNDIGAAGTYTNLCRIAEEQQDGEAAESWFQKAMQIFEKKGHLDDVINLAIVAERRGNFEAAEKLYRKSLKIAKTDRSEKYEALSYEYLGLLAYQQCHYDVAERWYGKALEIYENSGTANDAARNCLSLGRIARKQHNFGTAKKWFRKSLETDADTTWWDWFIFYVWLWWNKAFSIFAK